MKRELVFTADGSTSLKILDWDECYHSRHGAIAESQHVFIKNGLHQFKQSVNILEIGFGTGLNALLTALDASKRNLAVRYVGIDAYPLPLNEANHMNFSDALEVSPTLFNSMHQTPWGEYCEISPNFRLCKQQQFLQELQTDHPFDLVYFDAFGYRVQPELWTTAVFKRIYNMMNAEGILVTYASKSVVRKNLIEVGFTVEKLPGPPGKREMLRAIKK